MHAPVNTHPWTRVATHVLKGNPRVCFVHQDGEFRVHILHLQSRSGMSKRESADSLSHSTNHKILANAFQLLFSVLVVVFVEPFPLHMLE
jgi:hypothetical protein